MANTKVPVELFDAGAGFTIGSGAAEDTKIVFDGNAQDFYIGLDDSADDLLIGLGSTVGTTPIMSFDENKDVTINEGKLTTSGANGADNQGLNITDTGYSKTHKIYGDNSLHIQADSGQQMLFKPNATEAARFNADGNFLLGATSATASEVRIDVQYSANPIIQVRDTTNDVSLWMQATDSVAALVAPQNAALIFGVGASQTERMRINAAEDSVAIGGTSAARTLHLYGIQRNQVATTVNYPMIEFYNNNGGVGQIRTSGTATAYDTSSDYRLKENVSYDWDATSRLKQLKPARFNFITDADTTLDGFLAHEVSDIVSGAVSGEKDAVDNDGTPKYQSIDHSKLVPLLVKTIQELEARITTLEGG